MKQILLSDFTIKPIISSAKRLNISDAEYFSKKYENYVSNSRLKNINPEQSGCPSLYKAGISNFTTSSLQLGSAVHELFLQPDDFVLAKAVDKPTAKMGMIADSIIKYRNQGFSIYNSIKHSCLDIGYYDNTPLDNKLKKIIKECISYYFKSKDLSSNSVILSNKDRENCIQIVNSLRNNRSITSLINPSDLLSHVDSYNEDSIFLDVLITYQNQESIVKLKMKADN